MKKYTFEVYGRRKHRPTDLVLEQINKVLQEVTNSDERVTYNTLITTMSFEAPENKRILKKVEKFKAFVQETFEEGYSDVAIKEL